MKSLSAFALKPLAVGALLFLTASPSFADYAFTVGEGAAPGSTAVVSLSIPVQVSDIAGLDLQLEVSAPLDAPPLVPTFAVDQVTRNWQALADPQHPWRMTLVTYQDIAGPAELLKLGLKISPFAAPGTSYTLHVASATSANNKGVESDIASLIEIHPPTELTTLGAIGSVRVKPGGTVSLPITLTSGASNVAGFDLSLNVYAPAGALPLTLSFAPGAQTQDWLALASPTHSRYALFHDTGINGPAEIARVNVTVPPSTPLGSVYTVVPRSVTLADETGAETDTTAHFSTGLVVAQPAYGDFNGDGVMSALELNEALRLFLGIRPPTANDLAVADVRPKPGTDGRAFGDGSISADDLTWLMRYFLGLETEP